MIVQLEAQLFWYGREYSPGDQIDLPEADAIRLLARGYAVSVDSPPVVETAALRTTPPKGKQNVRNTAARTKSGTGY